MLTIDAEAVLGKNENAKFFNVLRQRVPPVDTSRNSLEIRDRRSSACKFGGNNTSIPATAKCRIVRRG
jgi:hypothetical protein